MIPAGLNLLSLSKDASSGPSDEFFSSVSLLLPMDTDFVSVDDDAKTPTLSGATEIDTDIKVFGAGSGDFTPPGHQAIYTQVSNDFVMGTGISFTVEYWVRIPTAQLGDSHGYVTTATNNNSLGFFLNYGSGKFRFLLGKGTGPFNQIIGDSVISGDTWYHIAGVYNDASGNMHLFVDGVEEGTSPIVRTVGSLGLSFDLMVSRYYTDIGIAQGRSYLDDIRVTKGVARYTSNFTIPAEAFPTS